MSLPVVDGSMELELEAFREEAARSRPSRSSCATPSSTVDELGASLD